MGHKAVKEVKHPRQSRGLVFVNRSKRLILEPPKGGLGFYFILFYFFRFALMSNIFYLIFTSSMRCLDYPYLEIPCFSQFVSSFINLLVS
jgi:hypothetical protein